MEKVNFFLILTPQFCSSYLFMLVLYFSGRNESGTNKNNESEKAFEKTKEYVWRQNGDYVGGATC